MNLETWGSGKHGGYLIYLENGALLIATLKGRQVDVAHKTGREWVNVRSWKATLIGGESAEERGSWRAAQELCTWANSLAEDAYAPSE